MSPRRALTLFHVRTVPIRAHWTLLLVIPYLAFVLSVQFGAVAQLAGVEDARLFLPPLVWGGVLAVAVFASVAIHELAHALVALRRGGQVRAITLMLIGGVSEIARLPRRPRAEALIAIVGPLTSLGLGGLLWLGYLAAAGAPADLQMGLYYLAAVNLTVGVFNLLPAFPMDGGRVLRALLAGWIGAARATRISTAIGQGLAIPLALLGLWSGNLLLALVALFVFVGARAEFDEERVRAALAGLVADDLVPRGRPLPVIEDRAPVGLALPRMQQLGRVELLVTDPQGLPVTVLRTGDLAALSRRDGRLRLRDLAARLGPRFVRVAWNEAAGDALERAAAAGVPYLVVIGPTAVDGHGLVGLVTSADVATVIDLRLAEARAPVPPPPFLPPEALVRS